MRDRGDVLLFAIAARRQLSWPSFTEALDGIFVPDDRLGTDVKQVRSAVAALGGLLGHWDVVPDGQSARICIAPPVLATLPRPGLPTAVLCGSRSPDTLRAVERAGDRVGVTIRSAPQHYLNPYAPTRIEVSAESHEAIARLAADLNISYRVEPAAWALALASGSIADYIASLPWSAGSDLNWSRRDFDLERLRFVPVREGTPHDGLGLSAYEHPSGWGRQDRLWRGDQWAVVDRDWGRFAVLAERGVKVLQYGHPAGTLAGPRQIPLPGIPARALGLCSGRPPAFEGGDGFGRHVFGDVPAAIARAILTKLGQDCDT